MCKMWFAPHASTSLSFGDGQLVWNVVYSFGWSGHEKTLGDDEHMCIYVIECEIQMLEIDRCGVHRAHNETDTWNRKKKKRFNQKETLTLKLSILFILKHPTKWFMISNRVHTSTHTHTSCTQFTLCWAVCVRLNSIFSIQRHSPFYSCFLRQYIQCRYIHTHFIGYENKRKRF